MSIIQIKGRTTSDERLFRDNSYSGSSYILTDADEKNIEEFSIEITIGEGWSDNYSPTNKKMMKIDDEISIGARASIVIEAKEEIWVPFNRYGIIVPTGSMFLSKGILVAPAKIEPAFQGKLMLRLINTTQSKYVLKKGEKLASAIFFPTESTKHHLAKIRGSDISEIKQTKLSRAIRWLKLNKTTWIGWIISLIGSSLITFILTYFLYYKPVMKVQLEQIDILKKNIEQKPQEGSRK